MIQHSMVRPSSARGRTIQAASWDEFTVECICRTAGEGRFEVPRHVVGMALGPPHKAEFAIGSDKRRRLVMRPGDIQMVPADLSHRVAWERADFVLLQLDPGLIAESATEVTDGSPVEITAQLKLRDPLIAHILLALKHEAETGEGGGRLYAEALVTALCIRLMKHAADLPQRPRAAGRWQRLTADYITEYIEANLAGDLTLSELACLVGMGRHQFGQAFKATFGRPPHQYVLARRLRRARRLLIETDMSITAIAYAAGFSSHSHLTTTFRRLHGLTPRSYRRSR